MYKEILFIKQGLKVTDEKIKHDFDWVQIELF